MSNNPNNHPPFHRSQSAESNHPSRFLMMTHSMSIPSFQRRTADSARQFRDNITNVIREIQPLVETARTVNNGVQNAISISSFLNRPQVPENAPHSSTENSNSNSSFVINLDETSGVENINDAHHVSADNNPPANSNNNTEETNNVESMQTVLEAQQILQVLFKYVPFLLILITKAVYDYHEGIFIFVILFTTFAHSNSTVKKETTKRHKRSLSSLSIELLYIFACLIFVHYVFEDELHHFNVILNLILIKSFTHSLTVWNLLWIVSITDFILKLITITVKILLTMLPGRVIQFQKRGKIYLFIEAVSQLYRSIATVKPWIYYLLESYQGSEKIIAVFLSAFYMISKGSDLLARVKLLKTAFFKLLQNVAVGSSPSKEQIQTAGENCPICHDGYESPVLLQCRHIFCESCVTTWFDREQTCPLCRAKIVDDPSWRDGSTTYFIQLF